MKGAAWLLPLPLLLRVGGWVWICSVFGLAEQGRAAFWVVGFSFGFGLGRWWCSGHWSTAPGTESGAAIYSGKRNVTLLQSVLGEKRPRRTRLRVAPALHRNVADRYSTDANTKTRTNTNTEVRRTKSL